MKKKVKQKKENSERWLLTYADMITLLLALFIVLYAISNVDSAKYHSLAEALNESLGDGRGLSVFDGSAGMFDGEGKDIQIGPNTGEVTPSPTNIPQGTLNTKEDMEHLEEGVNSVIDDLKIEDFAITEISDRGLTITFSNDVFFDSGKADLHVDLKKGLAQISVLLKRIDNSIFIEGYTDDVPISSSNIYSSNWQLSAARAANVAEFLAKQEMIDGERLSAVGYGEYHPKASNHTVEGRQKNRRVEITILYDSIKELLPLKEEKKQEE